MIKYITSASLWIWFLYEQGMITNNPGAWVVAGALCCIPYLVGEFVESVVNGYKGKKCQN